MDNNWLSCEEVSAMEGITPRAVQNRCSRGVLPCEKRGNTWRINKEKYLRQTGKVLAPRQVALSTSSGKSKTLVMLNNKGGVSKTTLSVAVADKLGKTMKVLLVDMDPQGNATTYAGFREYKGNNKPGRNEYRESIYELLTNQIFKSFGKPSSLGTRDVICKARNFDLIPIDYKSEDLKYWILENLDYFAKIEDIKTAWNEHFPYLLDRALEDVRNDYDLIIIDTPPELGWSCKNALCAGGNVIIPIELGKFEVKGLVRANNFVMEWAKKNPELALLGIVVSRFGPHRSNLDDDLEEQLRQSHWGKYVFNQIIPRSLLIRESTAETKAYFEYVRHGLSKNVVDVLDSFVDDLYIRIKNREKFLEEVAAGDGK